MTPPAGGRSLRRLVRVLCQRNCVSPCGLSGGVSVVMDAGDSDAEVYEKYAEELIRFSTSLVGPSDAPDVLSMAVVQALASSQWAGVSNRRAYLYRSVLNAARSRRRAEQRRRARETRYGAPSALEPA